MRDGLFLPRLSLHRRIMPWVQASGTLMLALVALTASVAVAARILPTMEDERGQPDVIELAALETSAESEAQDAAVDAPEQLEESRRHIDEVKAQKAAQDLPQEQASPEAPQDDLRMAQEQTKETVEKAEQEQQATEKQAEQLITAPTSQASIAAEQSDRIDGKPQDNTSTAPDVGSAREGERRLLEWQKKLYTHIGRNKFYPAAARKQGQKGEAVVAFDLTPDGSISNVRLTRSSGSKALDEAAIETMRKSNPAPKPPANVSATLSLELPLRYALK
jgi:protein TonB